MAELTDTSPLDRIQDSDLVKADLRNLTRLESERAPWESTWRDIDERFPDGAGGFNKGSPGEIRGQRNYDTTHITANERFAAAGVAITTPVEKDYIRPRFSPELMQIRSVQLWCSQAGERLHALRHCVHTGFGVSANEDWDQLGRYGTSPVWHDAIQGRGLFYRTIHLSECFIDVDVAGQVDTVFRKFSKTARQLEQEFGMEGITPKMRECLQAGGKEHTEFEILHVVEPNRAWDAEALDWRRMPVASRYLALQEKLYLRRGGYRTMPISVSRHMTSPGEKYGRSPGIKMLPTIGGVNAMRRTTLRAAHKAVDPALLFNNDFGATSLASKPGGMNPGFVDDMGRPLVHRMPGGEQSLPYAQGELEGERQVIRGAFLEDFYKILTDPNSRMTTTEVLEVMAKQGVLVRPFADRYAGEKQYPISNRDLDLALAAGQIDPFPPEVIEAGEWPTIDYENPLAAMARAESSAKSLRYLQSLPILAEIDPNVRHRVNADAMAVGMAQEIGVKPEYIRSDEEVSALIAKDDAVKAAAVDAELLAKTGGAVKDFAQANQMSQAA